MDEGIQLRVEGLLGEIGKARMTGFEPGGESDDSGVNFSHP